MSISPLILDPSEIPWVSININKEEPEGVLHLPEDKPCQQCSRMCTNASAEGHFCAECVNTFKFCDHCKDRHPDQHQWIVRVTQVEQLLCTDCKDYKGFTDTCLFGKNSLSSMIFCQMCKQWRANNVLGCGTAFCNECYIPEVTDTLLRKEMEGMQKSAAIKQLKQNLHELSELLKQFAADNSNLRQKIKQLKQEKNKSVFDELSQTEFKSPDAEPFSRYESAISPANNAS